MLNDLECPVNPKISEACRQLLGDCHGRLMTKDFDVHLCHIAVKYKECIEDFHWRAEPSMPQEFSKYIELRPKDKQIFLDQNSTFFLRGRVAEYLDARDMIRNINNRNMSLLVFWTKLEISEEAREVVNKVLNTFSGRM